jgi:hypothetical protein
MLQIAAVYLALAEPSASNRDPHRSQQIGFESKGSVGLVRGQCWKLIHRQQIMRRLGSAVALEVCTRCDDDEPQLIRCPHRDHVAFEQRPIRIIRGYRILTLPLHLRKRGRSVLPNMMQVMNAITPS